MYSSHELIMPNDDLPFKFFEFEGKNGNYSREKHWHHSIEIFSVLEGNIDFYVNDTIYPLKNGEWILVNSNEIHSIDSPLKNATIVLQIPLPIFEPYFTGEQFIWFSHRHREQDEPVMKLIIQMYETYQAKKYGYEYQVQSIFYQLLFLLICKYRTTEVTEELLNQNRKLTKLSAITSYLREHYKEVLTLTHVSGKFGYSPAYLSRIFQKYVKIGYRSYLENIRLEYAYKELAAMDTAVSDIALNHGFPNSKAFSNAFRKKFGILPSEFRRRKRQKSDID